MTDFEDQLARSLANPSQPPDETFVAKVSGLVDAEERARIVRLTLATTIALVLVGVFCYGLALAWNAVSNAAASPRDTLTVAASLACALAVILSLPLAFARD